MVGLVLAVGLSGQTHPRLFFGPEDVPELRQRRLSEPHQSIYQRLWQDRDSNDSGQSPIADWASVTDTGQHGVRAMRQAFLYVLTGEDSYAQAARQSVEVMLATRWADSSLKGLTSYSMGARTAYAFDWCYDAPSWQTDYTPPGGGTATPFRLAVSTKLKLMADMIVNSGGAEQNTNSASNWQGIRGASGLICYLATDDAYDPAQLTGTNKALPRLTKYLQDNLGPGVTDSHGWNIEGIGYTIYPFGSFIGPAGIALHRTFPDDPTRDLRLACAGAPWTLWTTYSSMTPLWGLGYPLHPDFGDDNPHGLSEGTASTAFWWCPEALRPELLFLYQRFYAAPGPYQWEPRVGATVWAYLYYPTDLVPQNPGSAAWREGFSDTGGNGHFTFRNRYDGADDVIAQMYVKLRGNKGHAGPDGLSFRLFGLNSAFGTGGGRYGIKTNGQDVYNRSMNSVYPVDPDATLTTSGNSGTVLAPPFFRADGSGHLVAGMPADNPTTTKTFENISNLGTADWQRRFVVSFDPASGAEAVVVVADSSTNGRFWQMCAVEEHPIATGNRTFTIFGRDGASLRGTVVYPLSDPQFAVGTRLRGSNFDQYDENNFVHCQSADGEFVVVLTLARDGQPHPEIQAAGTWDGAPNGSIAVGGFQVALQGEAVTYGAVTGAGALAVPEGQTAQLPVKLPAPPAGPVTVTAALVPGGDPDLSLAGATELSFTPENWDVFQPLTIAAGADPDAVNGPATLLLTGPGLADRTVALEERDASSAGQLRFTVAERQAGEDAGTLHLQVERFGGSAGAVGVTCAVSGGDASPGTDYQLAGTDLQWPDGDLQPRGVTLTILDDALTESEETLVLALANPTGGASLGAPALCTVRLFDDDPNETPVVRLTRPAGPSANVAGTQARLLLQAEATDDANPGPLAYQWTALAAAGTVAFESPQARDSAVELSGPGTYVLQLAASDGLSTGRDQVTIYVGEAFAPEARAELNLGSASPVGSFTESGTTLTLRGAGSNLGSAATDDGYFVYWPLAGDREMIARVRSVAQIDANSQAGLMFRADLAPNAVCAAIAQSAANTVRGFARSTTGATPANSGAGVQFVMYWVRLVRQGSTISSYYSRYGDEWTLVRTDTFASLPDTLYAGLVVGSRFNGSLTTAVLDNFSITPAPVGPNLAPQVAAGPDAELPLFGGTLAGSMSDTGGGLVNVYQAGWRLVSGPGEVFWLPDASDLAAQVTFSAPGSHVLRLWGDDGEVTAYDDVTIQASGPVVTFGTWSEVYFTPGDPDGAPGADPDHDGVPNLLEYLLGGEPRTAQPLAAFQQDLRHDGANTDIVFTLSYRLRPDATPVAENSTDLDQWWDMNGRILSVIDGVVTKEFTFTVRPSDPPRFLRLRAVAP